MNYTEIEKLLISGQSVPTIAKSLKVSRSYLHGQLRNLDWFKKYSNQKKLSPQIKKKLIRSYTNGDPLTDIIEIYSISSARIYQILEDAWIPPRSNLGRKRFEYNQ